MLVLTRKDQEAIQIGEILITVVKIKGKQVRLGITCPRHIKIDRLDKKGQCENKCIRCGCDRNSRPHQCVDGNDEFSGVIFVQS